jgi:hypothetical protein
MIVFTFILFLLASIALSVAHYKVKQHVIHVCFTFISLQSKTACDTFMFLHLAHLLIKYKMKKAHTFGTVPKSNISGVRVTQSFAFCAVFCR